MSNPHRTASILLVALAAGLLSPPARADVVFGPPPSVRMPDIQLPPSADGRAKLWRDFRSMNHNSLYPGFEAGRPNHARAMIELTSLLVFETIVYWAISPTQKRDWDTRFNANYPRRRLVTLQDVRFDNNALWYNNVAHPLLGSYFYQLARTNDLGPASSLAMAALGGAVWEFACEVKEKVSINDMVTTAAAGMALGETVAQFGAFFERGSGSWIHQGLALLFSPMRALHNRLDKVPPRRSRYVDALGMPADVWHRFDLRAGWAVTRETSRLHPGGRWRDDATLDLDMRIVNIMGAGLPGAFRDTAVEGNVSKLAASLAFGRQGVRDFAFQSRAGIVGGYQQDIRLDAAGRRRGYSLYMGGASSFDFFLQDGAGLFGTHPDVVSNTGILGPLLVVEGFADGWSVSATMEAYPAFSLVRSLALPTWARDRSIRGIPSVLRLEGYYFAFGLATRADLRIGYRGLEAAAWAQFDALWCLRGADRFQDLVTDDPSPRDDRLVFGGRLAYRIPGTPLGVGLHVSRRIRTGSLRQVHEQRAETLVGSDLDVRF